MTREFVKYEQALALKELGFNEPCMAKYNSWSTLFIREEPEPSEKEVLAPLYQQAFRWFREKYKLYPEINLHDREDEQTWRFSIIILGEYNLVYNQNVAKEPYYKTYEEAEQACLDKLIEICKNK